MKKLLAILFISFLALGTSAQISDFTLDSCYSASTTQIKWVTIDSSTLALRCAEEYGFEPGDNENIVFGLRFANMGQHDAAFPYVVDLNGVRISDSALAAIGLHWDSCHGHLHIEDWGRVRLLDQCGNVVDSGGKIGLNMYDSQNLFSDYLLTPFGACTDAWLRTYGIPDYTLASHEPNDEFNGTTRLGQSAGFFDTYNNGTWGNNVRSNNVPNGNYILDFILNASLYFNQGFNIFPDGYRIPITLSGEYPPNKLNPRTISVNASAQLSTPAAPYDVTAEAKPQDASVTITYSNTDTPCSYRIVPFNENTGMMLTNISFVAPATGTFNYPKSVLSAANQLLGIKGVGKYRFYVRAENGNLVSAYTRSSGSAVNVK